MEMEERQWTVMIYMAGDNNLSEEMIYAIKEMYRVGTNDQFYLIVQFDPSAVGPGTRRYIISDHSTIERVKGRGKTLAAVAAGRPVQSPDGSQQDIGTLDVDGLLEELKDGGSSRQSPYGSQAALSRPISENSVEALKDFISQTMSEYRAKHYMLILSGHGSGAEGDFLPDINQGDSSKLPTSLSIPALRKIFDVALGESRQIDILGMDSCLMSTAEVAHEVSKRVKYLVAAEGFELNTGWPYHRILQMLKDELRPDHRMEPRVLAREIVTKYVSYYQDYELTGASTDLSACNLDRSSDLKKAVDNLAGALIRELDSKVSIDEILLAHWRAQSYKSEQYVDLWDFCNLLDKSYGEQGRQEQDPVREACINVKNTIENDENGFVLRSCYSGASFQHSHGVSVYFPWAESEFFPIELVDLAPGEPKYENLMFAAENNGANWSKFLRKYLYVTRRDVRDEGKHKEKDDLLLRFDPPNETALFAKATSSTLSKATSSTLSKATSSTLAKTDSKAGDMKNPPVSFYRDDCEKETMHKEIVRKAAQAYGKTEQETESILKRAFGTAGQ